MIHGEHLGIKYQLELQPYPYKKYGMSTWYSLTNEYIFERSVQSEDEAKKAIEQLKRDGFL